MSSFEDNVEDVRNEISHIGISNSVVLGPVHNREEYAVGWICALPIELAAAMAMLDDRHQPLPQMANDTNTYEYGSIHGHNIVIACLPSGEYGIASATSVAKDMLRSFNIRIGLMVGIGGGVPKHGVHLGDVVVSKPSGQFGGVVQYDFGKSMTDGKFTRTGSLNGPPKALLTALSSFQSDVEMYGDQSHKYIDELARKYPVMKNGYASPALLQDILFRAEDEHDGSSNCESCLSHFTPLRHSTGSRVRKIHHGLIASGSQVMKDAKKRDEISNDINENVLCFEMEAAGLMNNFPCLVIRGICDYSDSHKNKEWQRYAAAVAAAYAKELLRHVRIEEVLQDPTSARQKVHWVVPFNRNKNFVGREAQLKEIMDQLAPDDYEKHCQRVAITGLGGIGKTQMALETAFRIREKISDCSVFWISAANTTNFDSGYRQIAQQLQIPGIDDDKADVKSLVLAYLGREDIGRWLLIVDNADDLKAFYTRDSQSGKSSETLRSQALADYLPKSKQGSILLTTRNRQIAVKHADVSVLTMREMSESESLDLLRKSLSDDTPITERGASKLLQVLTYLPLAIKQAAAYINEQQESIDGYLEICRSSDQELIQLLSEDFEDQGRYEGNTNPIALTWLISFRQIQQNDNLAAEYLFFMSCIAGQGIPHSLLPSLPTCSKLKQSKAIGTLKAYAFVTSREGGKLYDIHRLVQLSVQNWLESEGEFDQRSCKALKHVAKTLPFYTHESRNECALYFPHAQCILALRKFPPDMTGSLADLVHKAGEYFLQTGKYSEAENTYRQALELKRTALGDTHPSTFDNMNNLAVVYGRQGKYAEAEALQEQTLELKRVALGDSHPSMLDSMNNLAVIYEQRGKYAEAEALQKQTLKLKKIALGDAHPLTLDSMNNLAIIYQYQGKYAEAEVLQEQTLKLKRVALGDDHPSTLDSMNNLAQVYLQQRKYAEAEILQQQTFELVRTVLGGTHPSTLDSMNNLAIIYRDQGKYAEAEALQKQTLELKIVALGDSHPSVLDSMNNLAIVYLQQGKYAEAEILQQQTLKLTRATLGDAHPSMLGTMNNLATLYRRQGRYAEAEVLQQQALKLARAALGPTHPSTSRTMNNLAIIYRDQGKHAEAEALRQQVLQLTRTPLW